MPNFMSGDPATCRYTASPDAALEAVRGYEGPLLVDLDETLYLRNSTEDFIDCARPGLLALLLLRFLDMLKPWRLTGGNGTRDNWRVCAISTLFPWTARRWRAKVPILADRYLNRELKAALEFARKTAADHRDHRLQVDRGATFGSNGLRAHAAGRHPYVLVRRPP